jgi:hypothetical protein
MIRHGWTVWITYGSCVTRRATGCHSDSQTLTRYLNVVFTLQGLRYNTATVIGQRLEASRRDWQQLSAAEL